MNSINFINLAKFASGLLLNQKNLAFYKEAGFEAQGGVLGEIGVDTSTILGGILSDNEEILKGGIYGDGITEVVDGVTQFVFSTEPITASFQESSRTMSHPLEWNIANGNNQLGTAQNYIADHSIVLPSRVSVNMAMPYYLYKSLHREMQELKDKKTLIAIVSKMNVYHNMVLTNFSYQMDARTVSRVVYKLDFEEIQVKYPQEKVARNEDDANRNN